MKAAKCNSEPVSDCQQGQLFPHKPVVYLRGYLTAFLTHSPSGLPHSSYKNKRAFFRAVPSAGHSRNRVLTEPVTHYRLKEWSSSPIKSLRIILMLRKWSLNSTAMKHIQHTDPSKYHRCYGCAHEGRAWVSCHDYHKQDYFWSNNWITWVFSIGRPPKNIILNKKDRQRGLTALWNYLLKPWLHVDAIPLSQTGTNQEWLLRK